jgi:hypothetical protein
MRHTVLTSFAAISLLALVVIAVLWIRSDRVYDGVTFWTLASVRPATAIENARPGFRLTKWQFAFAGLSLANDVEFLHHDHRGVRNGNVVDSLGVTLPYGLLFVLSGVVPFVWFPRYRRSRTTTMRRDAGLCVTCGYDLRASPQSCPECGTRPAPTAA